MGIKLHAITMDSREPVLLARFWAQALGGVVSEAGNGYLAVSQIPGLSGQLLIQPVDDQRGPKNPIHLDLTADDPASELARLVAAGASIVEERSDSNFRWWVLADPEGHLFCLG